MTMTKEQTHDLAHALMRARRINTWWWSGKTLHVECADGTVVVGEAALDELEEFTRPALPLDRLTLALDPEKQAKRLARLRKALAKAGAVDGQPQALDGD